MASLKIDLGQPKYSYKSEYKVLDYFTWGELSLDKGEVVYVTIYTDTQNRDHALVTKKYHPEQCQVMSPEVVWNMEKLEKLALLQHVTL